MWCSNIVYQCEFIYVEVKDGDGGDDGDGGCVG